MPWTPNLSVGVKMIDDQHKMWFEKAEKLFDAGKKNQAAEYIGELLSFLEDYTKKHFADEEKYMLSIHYPEYAAQKQAHTMFIGRLAKLRSDYNTSGGNLTVILNANKVVLDWLTQHISTMDKKIGQYAKTLQK
ncbi:MULTISPECIES: bacteriohemerythrin [Caproicibacterium]|uniref:Bacteriohemerythrin n=1 Tax=Caproicibacterium argilliputei TaxID=3030016 RepID=A0AA97H1C9_9FIRM|nr:bacteriohemerythrin [Caproicibacterium argilliputei]WOC32308.1 bacteriohemerythrin [Caproicibacterium argilliputei]